jgi:hypothetical protein
MLSKIAGINTPITCENYSKMLPVDNWLDLSTGQAALTGNLHRF